MTEDKTIAWVVRKGLCAGCATYVPLCPCSAIDLVKGESKGVYLPVLDISKCNQCGICFDVCPGHSVDFKNLNLAVFGQEPRNTLLGNYLNCYTGYATHCEIQDLSRLLLELENDII